VAQKRQKQWAIRYDGHSDHAGRFRRFCGSTPRRTFGTRRRTVSIRWLPPQQMWRVIGRWRPRRALCHTINTVAISRPPCI